MERGSTVTLDWVVVFREPIASADPECRRLVELVDANPVMTAAEDVLRRLQPRKRFETDMQLTVGSVRATNLGTWFPGGREVPRGIAKRDEYLAKDALYIYARYHFGSHVGVGTDLGLTRPAFGSFGADPIASLRGHVGPRTALARERHLPPDRLAARRARSSRSVTNQPTCWPPPRGGVARSVCRE